MKKHWKIEPGVFIIFSNSLITIFCIFCFRSFRKVECSLNLQLFPLYRFYFHWYRYWDIFFIPHRRFHRLLIFLGIFAIFREDQLTFVLWFQHLRLRKYRRGSKHFLSALAAQYVDELITIFFIQRMHHRYLRQKFHPVWLYPWLWVTHKFNLRWIFIARKQTNSAKSHIIKFPHECWESFLRNANVPFSVQL